MAISQNFPNIPPSLLLDFAKSKKLDSRITFTRGSTGTYVDDNGLIRTAGINEARFDHDPNTLKSLGLLIEESRTNLVSYSSYNAATWSNVFPANATLTTGIDAPDGSTNAIRLTCSATGSSLLRVSFPTFTPNGTDSYTTSFYVRLISGNTSSGNILSTDLEDGSPSGDYLPNLITNQWVRVSFTAVPTATAKSFIDLLSDNTNNYVLDFWGVQVEAGKEATSYIPTTSTTATRSIDVAYIDGTSFTNFYNQTEGTLFTSATYNGTPISGVRNRTSASIGGGVGFFWQMWWDNTFGGATVGYNGSSYDLDMRGSSIAVNTSHKLIASYKTNDCAFCQDGGTVATDTSALINADKTTLRIGDLDGNHALNGRVSQLTYYPRRLSNTYLQELTK